MLRMALLVFACCACAPVVAGCSREQSAELVTYAGINAIRRADGLPALRPDATLVRIARIRSEDMATKRYFSHYPPDGCNFTCLIDAYEGPHQFAGENIAFNSFDWSRTAEVAVQMWHDSPSHLANIVNCHYERVGTGVAQSNDGTIYYTMIFEGAAAC